MSSFVRSFLPWFALLAPLLSQEVNVALGGTATRSALSGFGDLPQYAIDGNRDGVWAHNSTTVTTNQLGAWWQVALVAPSVVNEVVIWNRADCCESRLSNFRVEVSLGATVLFAQDFLTTGGIVERGGMIRMQIPGLGVTADRVRLSNIGVNSSGNYYLQFSEVEVIRYGAARQVNFAHYGVASASSNNTTAGRLIDGSTDGLLGNNRAFQTQNLPGSWVRVDVPRNRIDRLKLWPVSFGQAGCGNFRVSIFDGANEVFGQNFYGLGVIPINAPTIATPPAGTFGDSVRVTSLGVASNGQHRIELAELEVLQFGNQIGDNRLHGIGCRGGAGLPTLRCSVRPQPSAVMTYSLTNAVAAPGIAVLVIGASNQSSTGLPLPFNLGVLGASGCWLLTSVDVLLAAPVAANAATFQLALPSSSGILGFTMWSQGAVFDPINTFGMVLSNGIEQVVGL